MLSLLSDRISLLGPWTIGWSERSQAVPRRARNRSLEIEPAEGFEVGNAVEFVARTASQHPGKKWAVLGKGPSSDRYAEIEWSDHHVVSLNHAVRLGAPLLAHFVDMEALHDNADLFQPGQIIVMPWRPHVKMSPTSMTLRDWCAKPGPLRDAHLEGRLLSYNATCHRTFPARAGLPSVSLKYFSAEAGFNILAGAGLKTIHTLGVDGGTGYGVAFDQKDRLANGLASFDQQLEEIARTCQTMNVRHVRLGGTGILTSSPSRERAA